VEVDQRIDHCNPRPTVVEELIKLDARHARPRRSLIFAIVIAEELDESLFFIPAPKIQQGEKACLKVTAFSQAGSLAYSMRTRKNRHAKIA